MPYQLGCYIKIYTEKEWLNTLIPADKKFLQQRADLALSAEGRRKQYLNVETKEEMWGLRESHMVQLTPSIHIIT